MSRVGRSCLALGTAALLVLPPCAFAEGPESQDAARIRQLEHELAAQREDLERQRDRLEAQQQALTRQQRALDHLLMNMRGGAGEAASDLPSVAQGPQPPKPLPPRPVAPQPVKPTPAPQAPTAPPTPPVAPETAAEPSVPAEPDEAVEQAADDAASGEAQAQTGPAEPDDPLEPEVGEPDPDTETAGTSPEAERPKSERPLEQLLVETGSVLLPEGVLQVQPGFEYTHFSDSAVAIAGFSIFGAILIGSFSVDRLDRDVYTTSVTSRYGLFERVQLESRIPFVIREDREVIGVGTPDQFDRDTDNFNIGDMTFGALWQPIAGRGWKPNVILNATARFPTGESPFGIPQQVFTNDEGGDQIIRLARPPTGNGFYGLTGGFNTVWRSDPAVLFFGGSYTANFPMDQGGGFGNIDPGDTLDFFLGMNVSLSERIAMNLSFVDSFTFDTTQNGRTTPGSSFNDGRLVLGASLGLTPGTSIIFAAAAGLTNQSPDFQFTARVPLTWRLPPIRSLWD